MSEAFIWLVVVGFTTDSYHDLEYLGNFTSCERADQYIAEYMPEVKESKCLIEDHIIFNPDMERQYIK
jgi:hypothetical protein